jgi:hypothetical protein
VAATTDSAPAQPGQTVKFSWKLNSADWQSLYVGVIASLVTVMIVAVALVATRHLGHIRLSALDILAISVGPAILAVFALLTNKVSRLKWLTVLILLVIGLDLVGIVGLGLLFIIGDAAGIH